MTSVPDLVVPGAAMLRLIWTYGSSGAGGLNVIGATVQGATVINQTLANTLDTAIKSALTSSGLVANVHTSTSLVAVAIRDIRAAHLVEFIGSGASVPGTGAGDPLPRQVAFVISLKTARSGTSYRGRVYLGGLTEAGNDPSGNVLAAIGTNGVAFVNAIGSALSANGLGLAVVSRPAYATTTVKTVIVPGGTNETETKQTRSRPGEVNPVVSVSARNLVWDSQRRRTSAGSVSTLFARAIAFAEIGGEVQTFAPQSAAPKR